VGLVVCQPICPALLVGEVTAVNHGDLLQPQLEGGLQPRVARDDLAVGLGEDGVAEPELLDARLDGWHCVVVAPGVVLVRRQLRRVYHLDLHLLHLP
jgi:hypothetical protein